MRKHIFTAFLLTAAFASPNLRDARLIAQYGQLPPVITRQPEPGDDRGNKEPQPKDDRGRRGHNLLAQTVSSVDDRGRREPEPGDDRNRLPRLPGEPQPGDDRRGRIPHSV